MFRGVRGRVEIEAAELRAVSEETEREAGVRTGV